MFTTDEAKVNDILMTNKSMLCSIGVFYPSYDMAELLCASLLKRQRKPRRVLTRRLLWRERNKGEREVV